MWWIIGIIVVMALAFISIYNSLVRLRIQCDNAWSDIDVQLKRRWDLIPNIVETVKGYAAHEKSTFEAVTQARANAMNAQGPEQKAQAEGFLTQALKSLFAVAEAYPQLRAVESFTELQATLNQIEEAVQNARRYYNAVVRDLNTKIAMFPSNIVAGMFGFAARQFFEMAEGERAVPNVDFGAAQKQ
jgi:LemA protein